MQNTAGAAFLHRYLRLPEEKDALLFRNMGQDRKSYRLRRPAMYSEFNVPAELHAKRVMKMSSCM